MKKIILFSLLLAFGSAVMAQEVTMTNTSSNPAYAAPSDITAKFRSTNPDVTNVTWNSMNSYWVASYNRNNRLMHTYYGTNGNSFNLSLPVLNGLVSEAVITSALNLHPNNLYDITRMKGADSIEIYQVRTIDNGTLNTIYIDQNGKTITDLHTAQMNSNENNQMNNVQNNSSDNMDNTKTGTNTDTNVQPNSKDKYNDGTKIKNDENKTKIKNKDQ